MDLKNVSTPSVKLTRENKHCPEVTSHILISLSLDPDIRYGPVALTFYKI